VTWSIPVYRPGWRAGIDVSVDQWDRQSGKPLDRTLCVHVFAHASIENDYDRGCWYYSSLLGHAAPRRLTRKWIMTTLVERIETARVAILAVTEGELKTSEERLKDQRRQSHEEIMEEYRNVNDYFDSTLEAAAK